MAGTVSSPSVEDLLRRIEELEKEKNHKASTKRSNDSRCQWYACTLYPVEDPRHQDFLRYMSLKWHDDDPEGTEKSRLLYPRRIWIWHDHDVYLDDSTDDNGVVHHKGDLKKPHIHYLFCYHRRCAPSTVYKDFEGYINHFEAIGDYKNYLAYMTHSRLQDAGKYRYSSDLLQGDKDLIDQAIIQNANSVLLDLISVIDSLDVGSLKSLLKKLAIDHRERFSFYQDFILSHSYIVNNLCRDRENELENEFMSRIFDSTLDADSKELVKSLFWKGKRFR